MQHINQTQHSLTKPEHPTLANTNFKQSTSVITSAGTLHITLTPPPTPVIPLYQNPAVWVPIATIIGVVITIWAGWKKTKMELSTAAHQASIERDQAREQANLDRQHAAEQAHQERITKARREVYLEVISEMIKAQTALSLLPAQDAENLDIQPGFNGLITAVSKVSVLGEMATVIMSRELLTTIHQALFRLLTFLVPLHEQKSNVRFHDEKVTEQHAKIDQLATEIQTIVETTGDPTELARLRRALEYRSADSDRYGAASLAAKLTLLERQKSYEDALLSETYHIRQKTDELVASIRAELSLTTSLEDLHTTSEAMHTAAVVEVEKLRASFRNS